eukprot:1222584-Rhodomonas_salina.2
MLATPMSCNCSWRFGDIGPSPGAAGLRWERFEAGVAFSALLSGGGDIMLAAPGPIGPGLRAPGPCGEYDSPSWAGSLSKAVPSRKAGSGVRDRTFFAERFLKLPCLLAILFSPELLEYGRGGGD